MAFPRREIPCGSSDSKFLKATEKKFFLAILHFAHSCGVVFWDPIIWKEQFPHPRFSFSKLSASFHESFTKAVHIAWGEKEKKSLPLELFFGFYPVSSFFISLAHLLGSLFCAVHNRQQILFFALMLRICHDAFCSSRSFHCSNQQ